MVALSWPITRKTEVWASGEPVTRKKEMSNAEYYARAAASAHPQRYQAQSQYTPSQSPQQAGYFHAHAPHGHGYGAHGHPQGQGPYAVFA